MMKFKEQLWSGIKTKANSSCEGIGEPGDGWTRLKKQGDYRNK